MIKQVKTLWQGQIAVAEKFVLECLQKKEELVVEHKKQKMVLTPRFLESEIVQITGPYHDRNGGDDYRLIYYKWQPSQAKLI